MIKPILQKKSKDHNQIKKKGNNNANEKFILLL
jgi:hypothetical protein